MPSSFDAAIAALSHDENITRIKKLLIYACKSVWESEPYRLEYFDLRSLVTELLQLAPTHQQLRTRLDTFVRTLSKVDEYTRIADIIYTHLQPLCVAEVPPTPSNQSQIYQTLATQLLQESEQVRIKKLIYCACTHVWGNNPEALSQMNLADLLEHLYQHNRTPQELAETLNGVVRSLNRQTHYVPIAQRIQQLLQPLYEQEPVEQTQVVSAAATPSTQFLPSAATALNQPIGAAVPPPPPPPSVKPPPPPPPRQVKTLDLAGLMDVRLEVMKYSNPLRAKALLFAIAYHPLGTDYRTWQVLRNHTLDTLLRRVFQSFRSYDELSATLERAASALPEPEAYTQVAGAVLQALKPYYPDPAQQAKQDSDSPTTAGEGPRRSDLTLPKEFH